MRKEKLGSIQQQFVRAREILGEVLCVFSPTSPTKRAYVAVLEVSPLNFLLKAEDEQEALVERYRSMLKALTFPLQIIIRHEHLDLRPYLARLSSHIPERIAEGECWPELAEGLQEFLGTIGSRRTLIERHCYLVIPAPDLLSSTRSFFKKRQRRRHDELVARALQELTIRVQTLRQQLSSLGLQTTRLAGEDLARFYHRCLTPQHARLTPLQHTHLASVGHLPEVIAQASASDDKCESVATATSEQSSDDERESVATALSEQQEEKTVLQPVPARASRVFAQKNASAPQRKHAELPQPDFLRLADLLAPASIEEERDGVCIDGQWVRGITVTAFPREVTSRGWLAPLLLHDEIGEIVFHLHPQETAAMMRQLKRRRVAYSSTRAFHRNLGRLDDPEMEVAHNDVTRLMGQLARGDERIFEVSLLVLVRASNKAALDERVERLMALLQTVFLDAVAHPTTFEQAQAFRSFLPEARDELRRTITLDTASLATTFPFLSNALTMPDGAFLGMTGNRKPVLLDPWDNSLENPHAFVGGVTGAGKSYLGKSWLERSLLSVGKQGERCWVIDPDGEYTPLAQALGGSMVRLAPGSTQHLNPFDLRPPGCELSTYLAEVAHVDRLAEKISDLASLLDVMLAEKGTTLGQREKALLDLALTETYRRVGIEKDPRTHYHPAPLLRDLAEVLHSGVCGSDEFDLGLRLARYVDGSLSGLFAGPTNVPLDSHLLVWDLRDMRSDLRPVGMFLIADSIWTQAIYQSHVRRALYIDEAATLLEHVEGGTFLADLSRRARKRYLRLVVMTQNPELFVQSEAGGVVAANAAIKILKKQDRTSVEAVAARFGLTSGEKQRLITFGVQEAMVLCGDRRVLLSLQAGPREHALMTTNPVELASRAMSETRTKEVG
jgi:hypothetical protein